MLEQFAFDLFATVVAIHVVLATMSWLIDRR